MADTVLFIFGTRPEAVKMAPLVRRMAAAPDVFKPVVCVTGQHRDMVRGILDFFAVHIDVDLDVMRSNQSLSGLTARVLEHLEQVFSIWQPRLSVVQGDTTSAFAGALASFYKRVPVAHLEAGLRTGDKSSPFPEEANRVLLAGLADLHLAPTQTAVRNLAREGITKGVHLVTNTGIDALMLARELVQGKRAQEFSATYPEWSRAKSRVLLTCHRRENFGAPLERILAAVHAVHELRPEAHFLFPVHPNPNVGERVRQMLGPLPRVQLCAPLDYPDLVCAMNAAQFILTDSGGIQEEAPAFGKPVLVLRENSERMEGVAAGTALLVGSDVAKITGLALELIDGGTLYRSMARAHNPFGDGNAALRCSNTIQEFLGTVPLVASAPEPRAYPFAPAADQANTSQPEAARL